MTWGIIVFFLLAGILVYVLIGKTKKAKPPDVTYVCDACGEHDCICRRENGDR
jgi:hypothetical protein